LVLAWKGKKPHGNEGAVPVRLLTLPDGMLAPINITMSTLLVGVGRQVIFPADRCE